MSALPIARLFGFEIRIHVSWAIILAVIAVTVATQVEAMAPSSSVVIRWALGAVVAGSFVLSALAHELGHAIAARRFGAPGKTVVIYFFGGAATPTLEMTRPRHEMIAALAGPAVSLIIAAVFMAVAGLDANLSSRYQACAVNFNDWLTKLFGAPHRLDEHLPQPSHRGVGPEQNP